jgi:hypothetical protein
MTYFSHKEGHNERPLQAKNIIRAKFWMSSASNPVNITRFSDNLSYRYCRLFWNSLAWFYYPYFDTYGYHRNTNART